MIIDLRRASHREVSGARPKVERDGGPADLLKSRAGRLVALGLIVVAMGLGASTLLFDGETSKARLPTESDAVARNEPGPPAATDIASYAFLLPELEGLSSTVEPGTEIEIWATWEPPVTKRLKVQLLIPKATVTKVIPSIEPGPPTVMLELERRLIPDILFGDRFGDLSVVLATEGD
jgi:hypothetical protein